MSISVLASRSRQRAVLAGTSVAAVVAVIGFFQSSVVEMNPVAAAQPAMQALATAENAGTARVSDSAIGEPVSHRLTDEQDDQTDQADDDWDQQQEEEQQQEQEQQDWDQQQDEINTQEQQDEQSMEQSEEEAQEQNDAAEQQAEEDEQQAQMDEQQADQ